MSKTRTQIWFYTPIFSKFRAFGMLHPIRHVVLNILTENVVFYFSKDYDMGTAYNKRLK